MGGLHTVGGRVSELRFNFGPSYRVCFVQKRNVLMLMLIGGGINSPQSQNIQDAKDMLEYLIKEG